MKQLFFFGLMLAISINTIAKGNSNKKDKGKDKDKYEVEKRESRDRDDDNNDKEKNWKKGHSSNHGHSANKGYSNHQPKKVLAAFYADYPAAKNVRWDKYKGDYTATFNNGLWRSTAVYHANGERRDTRTGMTRAQLPGSIWDRVFKRDRITPTQYIQIERPFSDKIYRIRSTNNTTYYYDQNGNRVTYDY